MSPIKLMVLFLCTPWNRKNQAPNHPDLCGSPPKRSIQAAVLLALAQSRSRTVHYPNSSGTCTPRDKSYQIFRATHIPNKNTSKSDASELGKLNHAESIPRHLETDPGDDWHWPMTKPIGKDMKKKTTKDHAQQPPSAHYCHSLLLNVGARSSFSEVVKNSAYAIHPFFSTFHISILNQVSPFFIIRPAHYTSLGGYGPGHLVQ